MFGDGRTQNGVIVELNKEHAFDPADAKKLNEFRSAVWYKRLFHPSLGASVTNHRANLALFRPFIEKANETSVPYSRLTTKEVSRSSIAITIGSVRVFLRLNYSILAGTFYS
jgi:hypothetical protein